MNHLPEEIHMIDSDPNDTLPYVTGLSRNISTTASVSHNFWGFYYGFFVIGKYCNTYRYYIFSMLGVLYYIVQVCKYIYKVLRDPPPTKYCVRPSEIKPFSHYSSKYSTTFF